MEHTKSNKVVSGNKKKDFKRKLVEIESSGKKADVAVVMMYVWMKEK